jgi:hypothetical protein
LAEAVYEKNKGTTWISKVLQSIDKFINSVKKMWNYLVNLFTCLKFLLDIIIEIVGA